MRLIVLGSSSKGNMYILTNGEESLIIESGIPFKELLNVSDFNVRTIQGIIVTHEHGDHAKYIDHFLDSGFNVYAPFKMRGKTTGFYTTKISEKKKFKVGGFDVMPFDVEHDVKCYGYMIKHKDLGQLIFITDTYFVKYNFPNTTHFLVEANYDLNISRENVKKGTLPEFVYRRNLKSHFEIIILLNFYSIKTYQV